MKNIVSFETAKALKDAGFPQPEPEAGQFWYENNPLLLVCLATPILYQNGERAHWAMRGENKKIYGAEQLYGCAFAPTATDILLDMPDGYFLKKFSKSLFVLTDTMEITPGKKYAIASSPAEAAAAAWLALKKDLKV